MLKNDRMKSLVGPQTAPSMDWGGNSKLYDREAQSRELLDAYKRSLLSDHSSKTKELCLITGPSGTGKTALARSIQQSVEEQGGGFFLGGKFDDQMPKPHGPFLAAVEQLLDSLNNKNAQAYRQAIQEAVGSEGAILVEAIPGLSELLLHEAMTEVRTEEEAAATATYNNNDSSTLSLDMDSSEQSFKIGATKEHPARFVSVFCRFWHAIASQTPIVLLLDDLQWADAPSLDILKGLLQPTTEQTILPQNSQLMIVGTCRGEEVGIHDDLSVLLRDLEQHATVLITEIKVHNLTIPAMACMIADALDMYLQDCMPLAEIVHGQTNGNVFFAKQYLRSLVDDGILYQTDNTNVCKGQEWQWDEAALVLALPSSASVNSSSGDLIIQLLARKLQMLPPNVLEIVQTIACMGSTFSVGIQVHATTMTSSQILSSLQLAAQHGFLVYNPQLGTGTIPHDKFREAPLSLIPLEQRPLVHLTIGRNLRRQLSTALVKANVILIADQLQHGLHLVTKEDEQDDFARLYLRAGKEAAKKSAFSAASKYVDHGIGLLGHRHWRDQYNLSIELYSTGAELAYCIGDSETVETLATAVIANARSMTDKNQAIVTLALSVGGRGESSRAISICRDALAELDMPFPQAHTEWGTLLELVRVRHAIGKRTEEDIMTLPELQDYSKTMTAMKILYIMFNLLESMNSKASALPVFRLVRLTLKHGLSPLAGLGFHLYGTCLVKLGYLEEGYRFGQMATKIMERFPSKQLQGNVQVVFAVAVLPSKLSFRECIEPIWNAGVIAMEVGNTEMAMAGRALCSSHRILIGDPIPDIFKILNKTSSLCQTYRQYKVGMATSLALQLCQNLQGNVKDPLSMTGDYVQEREMTKRLKEGDVENLLVMLLHYKYMLAALMNENRFADDLYQRQRDSFKGFFMPFLPIYNRMYRGLVCAALARESTGWMRRRKLADAKKQYTKMKNSLVHCPGNCVNKMYLLDAELEFCHGRYSSAVLKYDRAIASAEKEGFISDQAIACEKAGRMLYQARRSVEAETYLEKARLLYMEWGAQLKVDQMEFMINNLRA
ncbi:expressed unknown protein [Seminavis robusta]|uniref:AAA+ ATPase domain-containing protein n=1 Tax=Seminavis robusta TaxID=568900 RepID=A0A9N8E254_9STRA|nr:expressed unknown protein [Seminavis robusta]|eukprot:Sro481_g151650.1 n/a (1063) ;mRNA; f:45513-48914